MDPRARAKILVVDDSGPVLALTRAALEEGGFDVRVMDSPFGLGPALNDFRPDLVLIDVNMPAIEGDELVRIARRHELHPCLMVLHSGLAEAELARRCAESGADGFIRKGCSPVELVAAVRRFLAQAGRRPT